MPEPSLPPTLTQMAVTILISDFLRYTLAAGAVWLIVQVLLRRRLAGRRIEKPGTPIRVGDILALPLPRGVLVIEVLALPTRRGPAAEAQSCYRVLDGSAAAALAARDNETPLGISLP